jgi:hypothetical protein
MLDTLSLVLRYAFHAAERRWDIERSTARVQSTFTTHALASHSAGQNGQALSFYLHVSV